MTCSAAPGTSTATAPAGEAGTATAANARHEPSSSHPARRSARAAPARSGAARAAGTCSRSTPVVLTTKTRATAQLGAAVRRARYSGRTTLNVGR